MTSEPRDPQLARPFAELRRADADKAPPFESLWRAGVRPPRVSVLWVAGPALSVLAAAAAVALWLGLRPSAEPAARSAPIAAAAQTSAAVPSAVSVHRVALGPLPLDFLLDQPDLATVPDFDSAPRALRTP